jgi:protein phosphatase-4 regulatory subunit 3
VALKFFRTCLGLHEESIHRQLVNQQLFEPILQIILDTMPRDTLLNSAALEIFEFIRRDHMNQVIKHLVPTYRETLESITYVETFQQLVRRYDQLCEPATTQELEHSFTSVDSETPARHVGTVNGGKWGQGLRELDPDEEAYFNGSDDEDEAMPNGLKPNGASPVRPLVNYPDDDNDDDDMDILATSTPSASPSKSPATTQTSPEPKAAATPEVTTPPERISEKRRREEDEEDELLASLSSSGTKRKASVQKDSDSPSLQKLRRKNSMSSAKDSGAPRKISISLPLKSGGDGGHEE